MAKPTRWRCAWSSTSPSCPSPSRSTRSTAATGGCHRTGAISPTGRTASDANAALHAGVRRRHHRHPAIPAGVGVGELAVLRPELFMAAGPERADCGAASGPGGDAAATPLPALQARPFRFAADDAAGAAVCADRYPAGHADLRGVGAVRVAFDRVLVRRAGRIRAGGRP